MYANRRNVRIIEKIGVEKYDGDVRFKCGSGNMAVSCMRNASGHNYRNSSFIVDLAVGQIPRSTEHTSSYQYNCQHCRHHPLPPPSSSPSPTSIQTCCSKCKTELTIGLNQLTWKLGHESVCQILSSIPIIANSVTATIVM